MSIFDDKLKQIENEIANACSEANRRPEEVTLLGISKTHPAEKVTGFYAAGLRHFGENKVQEAESKIPQVEKGPIWHFVGHLQTNKVKKAVPLFDIIESVDSLKLARKISDECAKLGKTLDILIEVNSSGESAKFGIEPDETIKLAEEIVQLDNLNLKGLMTIGPLTDDNKRITSAFSQTHKLFRRMQDKFGDMINTLSMGMSGDFDLAIKHGSTEVRIGTALFGARNY